MSKKKKEERKGGRRKIKGKKGEGKREGGKIIWENGSVYPCRSESIHIVPIFSGTHKNVYFSQFPYLYDEDKNTKYLNRWFHALNEIIYRKNLEDVQFSSVAQSCPTLCNPMDCSTPGLNVHHQLREFTQTHVHCVSVAIQPSLLSPSPSTFNFSQHQGLFKWVSSLHQVAKVLEFQLQHQSFQWTPRTDLL